MSICHWEQQEFSAHISDTFSAALNHVYILYTKVIVLKR